MNKVVWMIICSAISCLFVGCADSGEMDLKQFMKESHVESEYGAPDSLLNTTINDSGKTKVVEYLRKDHKVTINYHQASKDQEPQVTSWKAERL